ncbi:MAG: type IV pilus modification PilV family protein, partial [Synechocystis sp.]
MFEVLVALMMSFLFLTGTLNAMVVSAIFQVKAERQAQASYWIQENLEEVRATAASYDLATTGYNEATIGCSSNVGATFNNDSSYGLNIAGLSITGNAGEKELVGKSYRI